MQDAIQKRGTELVGFALVAVAVMIGAMLWSYAPEDSSWQSATSAPVQNVLGAFGAAIASRLTLTIGLAAWCLPALFGAWGIRFVLHLGDDRVLSRLISFPIFIAVSAIFLTCHVPLSWMADGWPWSWRPVW